MLVGVECSTGAAALVGGVLLAVRPDGSLLAAQPSALRGSPFSDWRAPGVLLAALVGGGFLLAAALEWRHWRHAHRLTVVVGSGLIGFELTEFAWIGFQPLEVAFALVGAAVAVLGLREGSSVRRVPRAE